MTLLVDQARARLRCSVNVSNPTIYGTRELGTTVPVIRARQVDALSGEGPGSRFVGQSDHLLHLDA